MRRHAQIRAHVRTLIAACATVSTLASAGLAQAAPMVGHYNLPTRFDDSKSTSDRRDGNQSAPRNDNRDRPSGSDHQGDRNNRPVFVPNPVNDRRDDHRGDRDNRPVFVPNPVNDRRDDHRGERDNHPVFVPNPVNDRHDGHGDWHDNRPVYAPGPANDRHDGHWDGRRDDRRDHHDNDNWKIGAGVGLGVVIGAAIGNHEHHEAPPAYYPNTGYRPVYRDSCPVHNDYYADNSNYGYYNYDGGGYHEDGYQSGYGEDSITGVVMERVGESEFFIRHGYDRIHVVMNRRLPGTFSCGDSIFLRGSFSGDTFYAFDVDITHNV